MSYGRELIIDMYGCDVAMFHRTSIENWLTELCDLINMERCDLHFWDYAGYPEKYEQAPMHLCGTSAVQFIKTSNITIHTLDKIREMYINLFSCKDFSVPEAVELTNKWFRSKNHVYRVIDRGAKSQCQNM